MKKRPTRSELRPGTNPKRRPLEWKVRIWFTLWPHVPAAIVRAAGHMQLEWRLQVETEEKNEKQNKISGSGWNGRCHISFLFFFFFKNLTCLMNIKIVSQRKTIHVGCLCHLKKEKKKKKIISILVQEAHKTWGVHSYWQAHLHYVNEDCNALTCVLSSNQMAMWQFREMIPK